MILNRRQTTLLYELLSNHDYLAYDYLCKKTHSCEKTVRSDVKVLNEILKEKNISISLKKNKGFILQCEDVVRSNLVGKFLDGIYNSADLNQLTRNNSRLIEAVFTSHDAVRIETLSEKLNISPKSVASLIKLSKPMFANYGIKLNVKPYYGIQVDGDEKCIRYLLSDLAYSNYDDDYNSIFGEGMSGFGINKEEIIFVTEKMSQLVLREKLQISHIELRKICARIIFGSIRSKIGFHPTFTDEQKRYIDNYFNLETFSYFVDDIERHTLVTIDENERYYLKMVFLASLDFSSDENYSFISQKLRVDAHNLASKLTEKLQELRIIDRVAERRFTSIFFPTCVSALIYKFFQISEDCPNSILKEIVCGTPLSGNVANVLYKTLKEQLDARLGELFRLHLAVCIYTAIREIDNKGDSLKLALYVSADVQSGNTLKNRILDRYSAYIESIDIISGCEILLPQIQNYDYVLYYGNKVPYGIPKTVKTIHLDYYFPITDSRKFYREIIIPRSKYENPFCELSRDCYQYNNDILDLDTLDQYMKKLLSHDMELLNQYHQYSINSAVIDNETLNIVLFAKNKEQCLTRMLKLGTCIHYQSTIISRIFIHVICIDTKPLALKTAEKIIRNVTKLTADNDILFNDKPLNFYRYFIYNDQNELL